MAEVSCHMYCRWYYIIPWLKCLWPPSKAVKGRTSECANVVSWNNNNNSISNNNIPANFVPTLSIFLIFSNFDFCKQSNKGWTDPTDDGITSFSVRSFGFNDPMEVNLKTTVVAFSQNKEKPGNDKMLPFCCNNYLRAGDIKKCQTVTAITKYNDFYHLSLQTCILQTKVW